MNGILHLNPVTAPENATIIITGIGRSGTSMAAGALHDLGVWIGSDWRPGIFEDQPTRLALYHFWHDMRADVIARYNGILPRWGFKFPSLHNHMHPPELWQFRAPRMVVLWRDMMAVSARAGVDPGVILAEQAALWRFVQAVECPVLMVSYEKAMENPAAFVSALAAFSGVKLRAAAVEGVGDARAYLEAPHE